MLWRFVKCIHVRKEHNLLLVVDFIAMFVSFVHKFRAWKLFDLERNRFGLQLVFGPLLQIQTGWQVCFCKCEIRYKDRLPITVSAIFDSMEFNGYAEPIPDSHPTLETNVIENMVSSLVFLRVSFRFTYISGFRSTTAKGKRLLNWSIIVATSYVSLLDVVRYMDKMSCKVIVGH